jgi:hypothetical protein
VAHIALPGACGDILRQFLKPWGFQYREIRDESTAELESEIEALRGQVARLHDAVADCRAARLQQEAIIAGLRKNLNDRGGPPNPEYPPMQRVPRPAQDERNRE